MFSDRLLLEGSIGRGMLLFSFPILLSLLFQNLYNTVDTVLIGYYLGDVSLGAIGSVAPLFELIVGFCTGAGQGFAIITGQAFGAGDQSRLKKSVALSILLSLLLGILMTLIFAFLLGWLLLTLQTPEEIYDQALSYILIITYGLLISIFYNLEASMLRAVGDSIMPLIILAISSLLNVFFDYLAIVPFHLGVAGAAYATVAAQAFSALLCLFWILLKKRELWPSLKDCKWDGKLAAELGGQGLSMGFMSSIVSIGSVILQFGINQLGQMIITAHTAARRLFQILCLPLMTLTLTSATFVSQNFGAHQVERIAKGIKKADRFSLYYCLGASILVFFLGDLLISWLSGSSNPQVIANGALYIKTNTPFFFFLGLLSVLRSGLQGLGRKIVPVISSVVEMATKIVFAFLIIPLSGYLGVCFSEPVCWSLMALYLAFVYKRLALFKETHVIPEIL